MSIAREIITMAASGLHANGQETEQTDKSICALAQALDTPACLIARWDELQLSLGAPSEAQVNVVKLTADTIAINRVVAINEVLNRLTRGAVTEAGAAWQLHRAASLTPSGTHLFALACATGAAALAITFGAEHAYAVGLIFLSAGLGGYLRRWLGRHGANNFAQVFLAALVAGMAGSAGIGAGISSDLRLVAVCPCMVLVPGPHLLNGTLDLLGCRIPLGQARIGFALLTLGAISIGLLLGLWVGNATLPPAPIGRVTPLWLTVMAGGTAAACFGVFFSLPLGLLIWPVLAGMISGAIRWAVLGIPGASAATGAVVASLAVGILLLPLCHRLRLPFAGVGFASVVSLMPGVFVFRAVSGLASLSAASDAAVPRLMRAVVADGMAAATIVLALTVGIVIPKHIFDVMERRHARRSRA